MAIRVYNADDHPIMMKGVKDMLLNAEGLEWVGSAKDGKVALEEIRTLAPDIAILDIKMPYHTGLDVVELLTEEKVETKFILFTLHKNEEFLNKALRIGVKGYMLKECTERDFLTCIHAVVEGRVYVDPELTQHLALGNTIKKAVLSKLSDHEIDILKLISQQKTSTEIAVILFISPNTVANHRANISKKLNLKGIQNGLLKWAMRHINLLD